MLNRFKQRAIMSALPQILNRFRYRLSWKLAFMICIAGLIPLYAASWFHYSQARNSLFESGKVRLEGVFHARAGEIETALKNAVTDLKVISSFPIYRMERGKAAQGADRLQETHKALQSLRMRLSDKLDEACLISPDGRELCRIVYDRISPTDELSPDETVNPFFKPGFETEVGEVHQGGPYISRDTGRWVVPFVTPLADDDGKKIALLHFEINLIYIRKSLSHIPNLGNGFAYILDENRHVIASTQGDSAGDMEPLDDLSEKALSGQTMPKYVPPSPEMDAFVTRIIGGEAIDSPVRINSEKEHYLAVGRQLGNTGSSRWYIISALPERDVFASLSVWRYAGFAAVTTFLLGLTAFLIGRSISRPIVDLYEVTMKIATGEIDVEVPESNRIDELGAFNAAFRAMMGGIRALVKNLEESTQELMSAKADTEQRNQMMVIKNLELVTHRQELQRQNKVLSEITSVISELILFAAEQQSFGIRYPCLNPVRCWEIMEGCDPTCQAYGSEIFTCQAQGGGPCCRNRETGAPPSIKRCLECPTFKQAHPDELSVVGENFNFMMKILENKSEELDETKKQLIQSEKMSSIGQLAAGVAHEINNPIGFISSNMTTLSEYVKDIQELISQYDAIREKATSCGCASLTDEIAEIEKLWKSKDIDFVLEDLDKVVKESLEGAKRVTRIVKNLKEFSHVDEAEWKLSNINEGIESTLSIIWNEIKYKATVVKEYGEIPEVECFPMQLNQVFMNLLVNAAHAIPEKGEIRIKTWQEDGFVCVAISDTGTGIPDDIKNKIFNPFFTTKGVGKGTGLGLSIAYGIIDKHKGSIKLDSKLGSGTTFTIRIPLAPKTEGQAI